MVRRRLALVAAPALIVSGCAGFGGHRERIPPPPPPPPPGYQISPSGTVTAPSSPGSQGAAGPGAPAKVGARLASSHRQYFDQRHRRYYYYDPSRHAYFWEDGTPKT